jgi:hypothetical protein
MPRQLFLQFEACIVSTESMNYFIKQLALLQVAMHGHYG